MSEREIAWSIEDIREQNPNRYHYLESIGAVLPRLLCDTAGELERRPNPHIACFFQVPYPINLELGWHQIRIQRGLYGDLYVENVCQDLRWDNGLRLSIRSPVEQARTEWKAPGEILVAQVAAIVPLTGPKEEFYGRYLIALQGDREERNPVVVPLQRSWVEGRSMRRSEFEESLCRRIYDDMYSVLRRLLPAYSILSFQEAPLPVRLFGFFVMPAPGRLVYRYPPEPTVGHVSRRLGVTPARPVGGKELIAAALIPGRQISAFEHQLFAMNRLMEQGEGTLALVGTLSLMEWYINFQLTVPNSRPDHVPSLSYILRRTTLLSFLTEPERENLNRAIELRNRVVHGRPPDRESLTLLSGRAGQESQASTNEFDTRAVIRTAFSLYRRINQEKRQQKSISI